MKENYQISENFKKRANECFKECNSDCLVLGTIRLYGYCDYCKNNIKNPYKKEKPITLKLFSNENIKEKPQSKEIEIPKYMLKNSKFPIDLIDFPIKKYTKLENKKDEKGKDTLELYLSSYYGEYHIEAPRKIKLMDIRTLLATLYFADYHKDISRFTKMIKEKLTEENCLLSPFGGFWIPIII